MKYLDMKLIKIYLPMLLLLAFSLIVGSYIGIIFVENPTEEIIKSLGVFSVLLSFFIFIEMIYFLVIAIKDNDNKNKILWVILIYIFNLYIIPYYNLKYVMKDPKAKIKAIILIPLSIVALIIGALRTSGY